MWFFFSFRYIVLLTDYTKLVLQVYYKFNSLSMLREPLMLISGFFFLFVACIAYVHADFSISKSSASYLAKLQWEEVINLLYHLQNLVFATE